jgi:hypothetical protein
MCWPRVGEANPLFSVYSTLCRWTATSNFINAVKRQRNITNFILDEIKRSISISVYYGWKRSIKNGRWREIYLKIIFWLQISYSPHSGTNTKIKWDMCLCVSWFYKTFTPTTNLVTIFHICTCDDATLVNEKSIVSWKYMKSNKKCVFNY